MAVWNHRIKAKRLEKGITLAQIADRLGVTEATAQRYESGNIKSVPYEHMCSYGEILGCSPSYLMGWDDQEAQIEQEEEFPTEIRAAARGMMELSESDRALAIHMIQSLAQKGREAQNN